MRRLTLDVIASTVFSYDTDVFNQDDNIFLKKLIETFQGLDPKQARAYDKFLFWLICEWTFLTFVSFPSTNEMRKVKKSVATFEFFPLTRE